MENFNLIFTNSPHSPSRISFLGRSSRRTNNKNQLCYEKKVNNEGAIGERMQRVAAQARNKEKEEKKF